MLNLLRAVFRMVRLRLVFRRRGGGICYVGIPVSAIHMAHDPLGQFPRRGTTIKAYHTHCLYNGLVDRRASAQPPLSAGARNNLRLLQKTRQLPVMEISRGSAPIVYCRSHYPCRDDERSAYMGVGLRTFRRQHSRHAILFGSGCIRRRHAPINGCRPYIRFPSLSHSHPHLLGRLHMAVGVDSGKRQHSCRRHRFPDSRGCRGLFTPHTMGNAA